MERAAHAAPADYTPPNGPMVTAGHVTSGGHIHAAGHVTAVGHAAPAVLEGRAGCRTEESAAEKRLARHSSRHGPRGPNNAHN